MTLNILLSIAAILVTAVIVAVFLRRVVAPNEVHIVQSSKATTSYGKDTKNGNTYYEWPSWIPVIGVTKTMLPVSVFDLSLQAYEAYDKGRVPFVVDIVAFFRVSDSNLAAQRVEHFNELKSQLLSIVQGAIRTVLASHEIDDIMLERSKFGEQFTTEVEAQLENWGVVTVKNIELMDIRDAKDSRVVHNIMEKKKSLIEMQSRTEVADNMKKAQIAEIDAQRDTETQKQAALQAIGQRTAEKDKEVGIAIQTATQAVKEQERITQEKQVAIVRVAEVGQADINKQKGIVKAEQDKETMILDAEGKLESKKREALAIVAEGDARANAEKAMQLAPVEAQIVLAKEIGQNQGYQNYLVTIRQVEASQVVGVEQAKALEKADVKIIANTGEPVNGMNNVMDLFTSKGGTNIGAMLEGLAQTDQGKTLLSKIKPKKE